MKNSEKPEDTSISVATLRELEVGLLSNVVSSKNEIVEILINNFENKYTTPFLLYSLGYGYDEIAFILELPVGIVKSRIFYLQKVMRTLLADRCPIINRREY